MINQELRSETPEGIHAGRWQDWLAVRLALNDNNHGAHKAVVNEGIGGNTIGGSADARSSWVPAQPRCESRLRDLIPLTSPRAS